MTVVDGLVEATIAPLSISEAVRVVLPAVLNVTLNVWVPLVRSASAGSVALGSEEAK